MGCPGGEHEGLQAAPDPVTPPRSSPHQDKSYRESKQRRRHCVAHLLGGIQPIRACRVLQRSTPVLVPFLLRGKGMHHWNTHRIGSPGSRQAARDWGFEGPTCCFLRCRGRHSPFPVETGPARGVSEGDNPSPSKRMTDGGGQTNPKGCLCGPRST